MTGIKFLKPEPDKGDPELGTRSPVSMGRRDDRSVWELQYTGIPAIRSNLVVHQPDPILPFNPPLRVLTGSKSGSPVTPGRASVGQMTARDEQSAVRGMDTSVTVPSQGHRQSPR